MAAIWQEAVKDLHSQKFMASKSQPTSGNWMDRGGGVRDEMGDGDVGGRWKMGVKWAGMGDVIGGAHCRLPMAARVEMVVVAFDLNAWSKTGMRVGVCISLTL
jgi:hypothetical protein